MYNSCRTRSPYAELREAVLRGLRESLRGGDKALVGIGRVFRALGIALPPNIREADVAALVD
jgi:hypothetical protein